MANQNCEMNMNRRFFSVLVAFVSCLCCVAADVEYNNSVINIWKRHSNKELMDEIAVRMYEEQKIDSLFLLYNYVAMRFDEKKQSREDMRISLDAMARIGYAYSQFYYDYPKAYSYLDKAIKYSAKHDFKEILAYAYVALGILYRHDDIVEDDNQYVDSVFSLFKKAYYIGVEIKAWKRVVYAILNLSNFAYAEHAMDEVNKEINLFYELDIPMQTEGLAYARYMCRGLQALDNKMYPEALDSFEKMKENLMQGDDSLEYYACRAEAFYRMGDKDNAVATMTTVRDKSMESGSKYLLCQSYKELYDYYMHFGERDKAKENMLAYLILKDKVLKEQGLERIDNMRFLAQIDSINIHLMQVAEKAKKQRVYVAIAGAVVLLLGTLLVIIISAYSRLRANHKNLYEQNLKLLQADDLERKEQENKQMPGQKHNDEAGAKYQYSTLSDEDKNVLFIKIRQAMLDTQLICSENFSIKNLAETIGEKTRDISQVINEKSGKNFHAFVNEYRIKEACRRINDTDNYGNYTLASIAESVGISRSQFAVVFKKETGLTPSEYMRQSKSKSR